ncbi:MAG: LysR substrate-binding domain-containing protein [Enterobacterales bacterium]|nr:LysR substrate-binding domain-containing protein [Enterobacterales bacterium]
MTRQSLPLQTLRAFEAAARTLSFTLAAKELNLSQSAISQQIKLLEQRLCTPLFLRLTRKLELTAEGRKFAKDVNQSLARLDQSANQLIQGKKGDLLTICATASINSQWLVHQLQFFRQSYPQIKLRVFEGNDVAAMKQANADIGLFYATPDWGSYQSLKLHQDVLFPVCSVQYKKQNNLIREMDILGLQCLEDADPHFKHWDDWFGLAGLKLDRLTNKKAQSIQFDNMSHMIAAAKQSQGIALVRDLLVIQELSQGSLVRLSETQFLPHYATYLVKSKKLENSQLIQLFEEWILQMIVKDKQTIAETKVVS